MQKSQLRIIYRSNSYAPLWLVADKSGAWEKNGLAVDTSPQLIREKAVEALTNGHVDLISGNHHNLYVQNSKNGEDFVHLAQATNNWTENKLVLRPGIRSVQDLRGKKIVADKLTSHAGLNIWLFLKQQGLDVDRGDLEMIELRGSSEERWKRVLTGEFDGTFVTIPHDRRAAKAGAHVIAVDPMPMIRGVTLTTTMSFVKQHQEQLRLLTRGFVNAIHFFLTHKQETLEIMKRHLSISGQYVGRVYDLAVRSLNENGDIGKKSLANELRLDKEILGLKQDISEKEVTDWSFVRAVASN